MQKRLKKYGRSVETSVAVSRRRITDTSLAIIATIHDYKIVPTSLLLRLVPGHEKNICKQLTMLYRKGLINRFAFMRSRNFGEFNYYLDNPASLKLIAERGVNPETLAFAEVRRNREKRYCEANDPIGGDDMIGKLLFLKHEVMISRFHAMLELACMQSKGRIKLEFQQGPHLWHTVEVPRLVYRDARWLESDETELLPHRPDALFSLSFPNTDREPLHFLYEADRHRTNTHKFNRKLRAHFHFIVKQKRHQEVYNAKRIRAVLTETTDDDWAEKLRQSAAHVTVSGPKPSPLFWFTTSRLFTQDCEIKGKTSPTYISQPDMVFRKIWASPVDTILHSLLD